MALTLALTGLCDTGRFDDGRGISYSAVDSQWLGPCILSRGEGRPAVLVTSLEPVSDGSADGLFGSDGLDGGNRASPAWWWNPCATVWRWSFPSC
jgi:hypothetical protein